MSNQSIYAYHFKRTLVVLFLGFCPIATIAQLNESDTSRFQLRLAINGILQKGNVDLGILRGRVELVKNFNTNLAFKSQNNGLYQQFSGYKADLDLNSRNYLYLNPQKRVYPFALAFWQSNYRLRIEQRFFTGGGITFQILQFDNHNLKLSGSLVYEETQFSEIKFNENHYDGDRSIIIWRPTIYLVGNHRFAEKKYSIYYNAYWQYGLDEVKNQRLHFETGLDIKLFKRLAISALYLWSFEEVVAAHVVQNDGILTVGLNYQINSEKKFQNDHKKEL